MSLNKKRLQGLYLLTSTLSSFKVQYPLLLLRASGVFPETTSDSGKMTGRTRTTGERSVDGSTSLCHL